MPHRRTSPIPPSLAHLPLGLFTAPMGLCGLSLAWRVAAETLGAPAFLGEALLAVGILAWLLLFALHGSRGVRHPSALRGDLLAPPALGAVALAQLGGGYGVMALALWGGAAVVALALLLNLRDFLRLLFSLSAWSYTFPADAFAIAMMEMVVAHGAARAQRGIAAARIGQGVPRLLARTRHAPMVNPATSPSGRAPASAACSPA